MKEKEFREWLSKRLWKGTPLTKKAMDTRVRRAFRAERGLKGLGFPYSTLDELFDDGKWDDLLATLTTLAEDPAPDMTVARAVVPEAEDPTGQLGNMIAGLKQYGFFREGLDPNYSVGSIANEDDPGESQADLIRRYVLDRYIEPARAIGQSTVTVTIGTLNNEMGLHMAWPNICQALEGPLFRALANVPAPSAEGPKQSTTRKLTFSLTTEIATVGKPRRAPTNLILYGPPGTGKTYRTAYEAVSLCDGPITLEETPEGRAALLSRYRALEAEKRIAFVTFHQNYDYESFVEGLRPETGDEEAASAGFRLEARPGIFREICAVAEQSRTRPAKATRSATTEFSDRRFWKMGQGAIGSEDDVYDAALANNYIALGWGGTIDWSAGRFSSFEAIKSEWHEKSPEDLTPSNWTQTWPFRSEMKIGDIVIVPYGNTAFRAVAEVTGDYRYVPEAEGYYAHRRDVRWLLKLDEPLPLDTIVDGNFTQRTLYPIAAKRMNLAALTRLVAGGEEDKPATIEHGEPDKRLGMSNALSLMLPYSKKRDFGVPANLHIIGTMNTADRSIALLDTALRRRFTFKEMAPQPDLLATIDGVDLRAVLTAINDRIEYLIDREHRIGHAFFMECRSRDAIGVVMRDKVIPLLQEYFFEDWSRIRSVLGDGFIVSRKISAPPGCDGDDRDSWFVRETFPDDAFDRLLGKTPEAPAE